MKAKLIIILFSFFSIMCSAQTDFRELNLRNGKFYKINSSTPFTGKIVTKMRKPYSNETSTYVNGYIKNGLYDGQISEYYSNGQLKKNTNYINGIKNGSSFKFASNGAKIYQEEYKNNSLTARLKYSNGKLATAEHYINNMKHGYFKTISNGLLMLEGNYEYGKKNGKWFERIKNRNYNFTYKNGVKNGAYKCEYYDYAFPSWIDNLKNTQKKYIETGQYTNGKKSGEWINKDVAKNRIVRQINHDKPSSYCFEGIWKVKNTKKNTTYYVKYENNKFYVKDQGKTAFKFVSDYEVYKETYLKLTSLRLKYRIGLLVKDKYSLSSNTYVAERVK